MTCESVNLANSAGFDEIGAFTNMCACSSSASSLTQVDPKILEYLAPITRPSTSKAQRRLPKVICQYAMRKATALSPFSRFWVAVDFTSFHAA